MRRFYLGADEYVRRGPPYPFLRLVVSPVAVVSTITLFATRVALLVLDRAGGRIAALHKASFVVWFGSVGLHVLIRHVRLPDALRLRRPGRAFRLATAASTVVACLAVATLTVPASDRLQDDVSAHVGLDAG